MKNGAITAQSTEPRYMLQLDGLRALAVFSVLVQHCLPQEFFLNSILHWGSFGVKLFFVLSGFLITGILLQCRDKIALANQDAVFTIGRFYIRRFLRIFPIYYLTIAITALVAFESVKDSAFWHLTYTSNIYFSSGDWDAVLSHFWTLAVEEQFYLIWPWVMLFVPKKHLLKAIIITISIGPLFRFLCIQFGLDNGVREYILTFACLDSLGMGALLAFYTYNQEFKQTKRLLCSFGFWVCGPLLVALNIIYLPSLTSIVVVLENTITSVFFVWLIDRAAQGFSGVMGTILELRPLVYLGKISYGIYIYHLLVAYILSARFHYIDLGYQTVFIKFVINTVATLIVAMLSWHFIEKPINDKKKYFGYTKGKIKL